MGRETCNWKSVILRPSDGNSDDGIEIEKALASRLSTELQHVAEQKASSLSSQKAGSEPTLAKGYVPTVPVLITAVN